MICCIRISKRDCTLTAIFREGLSIAFPCCLGRMEGDKQVQNDERTPEGTFRVCTKNEHSRFHRSLGLSYPEREDGERGLREGLISQAEFEEIMAAHADGRRPPWNTTLGGEIMIHGGLEDCPATRGCVGLRNEHVEWVFERVDIGCRVIVLP